MAYHSIERKVLASNMIRHITKFSYILPHFWHSTLYIATLIFPKYLLESSSLMSGHMK
jgi:hypothetical protein